MSILAAESKRIIRLYGILGATFGREFQLSVASPKEAIRALCVIVPLRAFFEYQQAARPNLCCFQR